MTSLVERRQQNVGRSQQLYDIMKQIQYRAQEADSHHGGTCHVHLLLKFKRRRP